MHQIRRERMFEFLSLEDQQIYSHLFRTCSIVKTTISSCLNNLSSKIETGSMILLMQSFNVETRFFLLLFDHREIIRHQIIFGLFFSITIIDLLFLYLFLEQKKFENKDQMHSFIHSFFEYLFTVSMIELTVYSIIQM